MTTPFNKEVCESAFRELVSTLHRECCYTGLITEEQWNEEIAPKLRDVGLAIEGRMPGGITARQYKFPPKL